MAGSGGGAAGAVEGLREPRLFWLLVLTNGFVGSMVGVERTLVPVLGEQVFAISSKLAIISFIATFGIAKALANLFAGSWSERVGRKRVLVFGWLVGIPVPLILMFAPPPHWWLVILANVLLGVNQGLCWSMTVIMKVDLAGDRRRGFAIGMNEFAGYSAVAVAAFATGYLAGIYGIRPWPFLIGIGAVAGGLILSAVWARETRLEIGPRSEGMSLRESFLRLSWRDTNLRAVNQAGLMKNLNDGVCWGLLPLMFVPVLRDTGAVGLLIAAYPLSWGLGQLFTGPLSDSAGRKRLIVLGMIAQGAALVLIPALASFASWLALMLLLGAGTAMVYPTLLGAASDSASPTERATAMGVYRFWRDIGFAAGALAGGALADSLGLGAALQIVGVATIMSGLYVLVRYAERMHWIGNRISSGTS
ncbi:MAG TPA: MFS transporter [Thermoplasmata archaeon]|nr:MFS transporter [Thermoplasmata archaeon]